jgi:hypothetical protein
MKKFAFAAVALILASGSALSQVELKTYADKDGRIDVQKFTCAQLANTFQEDADLLAAWYSGWYNGLAKGHTLVVSRMKEAQHRVIVYCKENKGIKVIKAIDAIFTQMRAERGIKLKED